MRTQRRLPFALLSTKSMGTIAVVLAATLGAANGAPAGWLDAGYAHAAEAGYDNSYVATPFAPDELLRFYPSDIPARGLYLGVLDGFDTLRAEHPEIIEQNLATAIAINNSATPPEQQAAVFISYEDREVSLADALGAELGNVYKWALADGRLPKVSALIGGDLGRAGLVANSTLIEKEIFDNPRPFVVAPAAIVKYDHVGGDIYSSVEDNGSYPSGHANHGYWKAIMLATWLPELAPQLLARATDIGNSRVVLGVHYPLDVIGGRVMGAASAADRLADPEFAALIDAAGVELREVLQQEIGTSLADFIAHDSPYLSTADAVDLYAARMSYGFPQVGAAGVPIEVPVEAAALLRARFPELTDAQRLQVLAATSSDSGYPLDKTGPDGGWERLNLAAAFAANVTVNSDGSVSVS